MAEPLAFQWGSWAEPLLSEEGPWAEPLPSEEGPWAEQGRADGRASAIAVEVQSKIDGPAPPQGQVHRYS